MQKIVVSFLMLLFLSAAVFAQDDSRKESPAAPSYAMEVKRDVIGMTVDEKGCMTQTEDEQIKILTTDGVARYSQVIRFYDSAMSKMEVTKALIIKPDGQKTELPASAITDSSFNALKKTPLYDSFRVVVIDFSGIEPGSTIEYYIKNEYFVPYPNGAFWEASLSQDMGPIKETSTLLSVPKDKKFYYATPGHKDPMAKPSKKTSGGYDNYVWKFKNVEPMKQEVAMPPPQSISSKVIVSSFSSWSELASMVNLLMKDNMECSERMKNDLRQLALDSTKADLVKKIYDLVTHKKEIIPLSYGMTSYRLNKAAQLYESPVMTSYDAALLLVSLYRQAGFDADLALVSSISLGDVAKEVAAPLQFDTLLVVIRGIADSNIWIDPANITGNMMQLPAQFQARPAFMLGAGKSEISVTPMLSPQQNREEVTGEMRLTADGSAECILKLDLFGSNNFMWRELYGKLNAVQKQNMAKVILNRVYPRVTVLESSVNVPKEGKNPFAFYTRYIAFETLQKTDQGLVCPFPVIASGDVRKAIAENVSSRKYPIYIGSPVQEDRRFRINIADDFNVASIPENIYVDNKIGSFQVICDKNDRGIYYYSRMILKTVFVDVADMPLLQQILDASEKARQDKILLNPIKK